MSDDPAQSLEQGELDRIDLMAGASARTVQGIEAMFVHDGIEWVAAYLAAVERFPGDVITTSRAIWLEGYFVGRRVHDRRRAEDPTADRRVEFDPLTAMTATTSEECLQMARAWTDGRRSSINGMMAVEASPEDRQLTLQRVAAVDAQTAEMWMSLARTMLEYERGG